MHAQANSDWPVFERAVAGTSKGHLQGRQEGTDIRPRGDRIPAERGTGLWGVDRGAGATGVLGESEVGFVPMRARRAELSAILKRATGEIVGTMNLSPWGN
jgi:hypothetical protein